jgi:hypothetical protein
MRHPYRESRPPTRVRHAAPGREITVAAGVVTALAVVRCLVAALRGAWLSGEVALAASIVVIAVIVAVRALRGRMNP